jgi:hypothetical protein
LAVSRIAGLIRQGRALGGRKGFNSRVANGQRRGNSRPSVRLPGLETLN